MATSSLGRPVKVKGDVRKFVEKIRASKTHLVKKPKDHDLIVRQLPPGYN